MLVGSISSPPYGRNQATRPEDAHGTTSGTPTGARAAEDVGPYHAPRHVHQRMPCPHTHAMRAPGRARAAPTERHRGRPRARGPPRTSAPTTPRAMSAHACHVRTRTPCAHPWQGAISPARRAHGTPTGRHRGRPRARGPPGTSAPTTPRAMSANACHVRTRTPCAHLVGRDVPGAPRPRDAIGDAHGDAGRRGRRPLPRPTPCPHTHATSAHARHARTHGRARRPRRAAPTGRHREHSMDYFMSTTTLKKLKSSSLSKISVQLGSERWTFPNFR